MISVLILTKNEEFDLPSCLQSIDWCDDIHVLDSFSVDRTVLIAEKAGAKVSQRIFDGYASQRNFALKNLNFKYDWILILDADEHVPFTLLEKLRLSVIEAPSDVSGFRIRRRDFMGKTWLKHAQISPFYIRLIRKGKASYHREINEVIEVEGHVNDIDGYFDHYPFSKGFSHWLFKHNQYSTLEAQRWIEEQEDGFEFSVKKALFSKDFTEKRYHQKGLFYRMPARPLIKWVYMIVLKRAFLDGRAGFVYATLQAIYEYFIVLKTRELMNRI